MAKKTQKQLDDEIDAFLRGEKYGPRQLAPLPTWDAKRHLWTGGDKRTLYTFTSPNGRETAVKPGAGASREGISGIGQGATVRVATEAEARAGWQDPLHSGWNVRS